MSADGPHEECPHCGETVFGVVKVAEFGDHPDVRFSDIRFREVLAQQCVTCEELIYRHPALEQLEDLPWWASDE